MENIIFYGVQFLIAILAFLIGKYVFPTVKSNTIDSKNEFISAISKWVYKFVVNAKNSFGDSETGLFKKEWVKKNIKTLLDKWGVTLSDEQIDALIESAYDQMKINTPVELESVVATTIEEKQTETNTNE